MNSTARMMSTQVDLNKKVEVNPEETFKTLEKEINQLIDDSTMSIVRGDLQDALDRAKEAVVKEKNLRRQREMQGMTDLINFDLTYLVSLNLAVLYQKSGMNQEALSKYNEIIKSKQFPQAGKLRVNMGNIYFSQKKYSIAIKMYRMALDMINIASKEMRFRILENIASCFVKLGQFHEAISSFESIMKGNPNFRTAFNLMLCYYALGEKLKMKELFNLMLNIDLPGYYDEGDDFIAKASKTQQDKLRDDYKEIRRSAIKFIVDSAKLISPIIYEDVLNGYDWIIDQLKTSNFPEAESEIEICKAMTYMKKKNIDKAIETLKVFEKKDKIFMARAASNISFLYFVEGDYKEAEKYADHAVSYDRYNSMALVNQGNCFFMANDFVRAKEMYLEAIGVEASCIEALYNLAFVYKKLTVYKDGLQALEKLQTIVSSIPEVIYQIANINELMGRNKSAMKWYHILLSKIPSDPNILARLGALYSRVKFF